MLDPVARGLEAISARSVFAGPLIFAAGVVSSIGPCVAPRFIAAAGLAAGRTRGQAVLLVLAFVTGLTLTYAAFGAASSLLGRAAQFSAYTYWTVAAALALGGCITLWRGETACVHRHESVRGASAGAALLLGSSFALVVSPCCTPLVIAILGYASAGASAGYASMLLACFALGHALPIVSVAFGVNGASRFLERYAVRQAASVVSAALMLALSAYYAVLA